VENVALDTTVASVITADTVFTLAAGSTDDDAYNSMVISVKDEDADAGGGVRERRVTDYAGATRQVTVDADFEFPIEVGDTVRIYLGAYSTTAGAAATDDIATAVKDAVWDESTSDHVTAGTTGKKLHDWRGLER
jgi:hypothetical protein